MSVIFVGYCSSNKIYTIHSLFIGFCSKNLNLPTIKSSNVESIGYENSTLEVKFLNGGIYQYYGVPDSIYKTLMSGISVGTYLAKNVYEKYAEQKIN